MPNLLYSCHDRDAHPIIPAGGWCVDAVLVTDEPPNYSAIRSDINFIVRLNNGWYPNGTIPVRSGYADYAKRCADFASRCKGANIFIISNEPNHAQEYPNGVKIEPEDYADCFNLCYAEIKEYLPHVQVLTAAIAPWDITSGIDWLAYYNRMLLAVHACDGLAVHGYTHGADPDLVWSMEKSKEGWFWHFPVIYQTLEYIPAKFAHLPVHVTETNQGDNGWVDTNSGWVQEAYNSIEGHNGLGGLQKILSLSLFRWRGDKWQIYDKNGVQDDFRMAVQRGYTAPLAGSPDTVPVPSPIPEPEPEPPAPTPDIEWDARLTERGCELTVTEAAEGQTVWRCVSGEWFDEQQAQGRVNTFVTLLDEQGELVTGVLVKWYWTTGEESKVSEIKNDPWLGHEYSLDFTMYNLAPSYGLLVADSAPSDDVWGMGLGSIEQPDYKIHTAYSFTFQRMTSSAPIPPTPTHTQYVTAPAGANLRAEPVTGAVMVAIPYGEAVTVDESQMGSDGYQWRHAIYQWYRGWIRADLLSAYEPEPIEPPLPLPTGDLVHPLPGSVITQNMYENPESYAAFGMPGHDGTDFGAKPAGTPIHCMAAGEVIRAAFDAAGYGNFVEVAHDAKGATTVYAHASKLNVAVGEVVRAGQTIALLGTTGNSTGDHLHLSVRLINVDRSYRAGTPMPKGRVDPRTWAAMHGLKL